MLTDWRLPLLAVSVLGLSGCADFENFGDSQRYKEDVHVSVALSPGGAVSLENSNGSVEITGWEQNSVEVNATKYASSKDLLDRLKVEVNGSSGVAVRIRTVRPTAGESPWRNSGVQYRIRVPRKALLDGIQTTNGSIRVEDVAGDVRLHSTNGAVRGLNIRGEVEARTTNGSVEMRLVEGNTRLQTTNGSIEAEVSKGSLDAHTTNGSINAALIDTPDKWPVKAHSTNGHIELRLRGDRLPDVRAETSNSSVTLFLPPGANARVRAHTSHSRVTSDFEISTANGRMSKSDWEGTIGSGGPLLELSSKNGSIKLLRL